MKTAAVSSNRLTIAALAAAVLSIGAVTTTTAAAQNRERPSGPAALLPVFTGVCATTASKAKVSKSVQSNSTTTPVDVVDTQIGFKQGGSSASCVIISFTSEATATANATMVVEALLDDVVCHPSGGFFVTSNATATGLAARAMNYVCPNVAPGNRNAKIRFRNNGSGTVTLDFRTTIVHYAK